MKSIEYPLETANANLAHITLTHRYPEQGYALNTEVEMIVYVLEGEVLFHQEDIEQPLRKDDVVLVKKNQAYFWQPQPKVSLLIFSTPPWTSDQQKIIGN